MIGLLMAPEKLPGRFSYEDGEEAGWPAPSPGEARLPSPQRLAAVLRERMAAHRAARRASSPAAW